MPNQDPRSVSKDDHPREITINSGWMFRSGLAAMLVAIFLVLFWLFREKLSIDFFAERETYFRNLLEANPVLASFVSLAIYVGVTGLSIPGALVLTLVYGWFLGFWIGLLVVSFGSTAGATLSFLISRYLLRDWVQQKFSSRLATVNQAFDREGAFYLFTARLIPAIPFFVINLVMGLTRIRVTTYWWVSQLGMLPATIAYVYAGASVPSLQQLADKGLGQIVSWRFLLALAVIGVLPLFFKRLIGWIKSN